jgi:hypothetical protein
MTNVELARRCAYSFLAAKSPEERAVADAARYRWLAATRLLRNVKPKAQLGAESDFAMRHVPVPVSAARWWVTRL